MKQKLLFLLVLLLTATTGAWAQTQWTSGSCTVTLNNGTLTVSGNGAMDDYANPSDQPWENNKGDITSVVVESGVTTVGAMSFCNFEKMTSVTLPEGLTSIGTRSFLSCGKLTSITIPSTVTNIGAEAFYSCTSVTNVNLYADPANLTWNEDGCDDFNRNPKGSTKCHVLAEHLSAYQTKFNGQVNVTFVGDLKPLTPATYSVSLAEGTEDAKNWTVKVGDGEAQKLPLEGLEGGEKITATYSGDRKVKSVKAVKKAAVSFTEVTTFNELQTELSAGKNVKLMNDIECTEGIEITSNGVTIDGNGKKLTLNKGISLASGATLTIQGNGTMVVNGTNENTTSTVAGSTGTLILTSGTLTATGGNGLGVDEDEMLTDNRAYAGGNAINGNVTVSGGTLTAIGGNGGSIGDYSESAYGADGGVAISGSVTVTDGTVTATGGNGGSIGAYAPGAKGGSGGAAIGGDATVNGGTWTASNGTNGGGDGGKAVAGTVTDNR